VVRKVDLSMARAVCVVVQKLFVGRGKKKLVLAWLECYCTPEGTMVFFSTNRATKHMGGLNASPLVTLDMWEPQVA
jgi:hypothetical protein